jgi:hypothetical protein
LPIVDAIRISRQSVNNIINLKVRGDNKSVDEFEAYFCNPISLSTISDFQQGLGLAVVWHLATKPDFLNIIVNAIAKLHKFAIDSIRPYLLNPFEPFIGWYFCLEAQLLSSEFFNDNRDSNFSIEDQNLNLLDSLCIAINYFMANNQNQLQIDVNNQK